MSLKFYTALGPDKSAKAFVHYPANTFPGQDKPLRDDTHHNAYGGYELARCVVEGIKASVPELATHLVEVDGVVLEGQGVCPDYEVEHKLAFSAGADPQMDAAIKVLRGS